MINQKEHGTIVHKFIKEYLLRGELEQSVFELTEQNTYASLKLFLEFRQPSASNFKTMSTGIKAQESIAPCGQQQCAGKTIHSKDACWVLHPEKMPKFLQRINANSPNDSTSAKKSSKSLKRAGHGRNSKEKRDNTQGNKAHQELQRIKTYLTTNNVFSTEDLAVISKGEDSDTSETKSKRKRSRKVSCNALRVVIKNSRIFEQVGTTRLADSASQATLVNEELIDLCSDLTPIDGDIVTAAGDVMEIIKFKGSICFMGVRIECLVADINTSIVSSGKTALENNFSWTFGPGENASVTSHDNNITIALKLVDNLYPLSKYLFTSAVEDFQLSPKPAVFTCLPCAVPPTMPAHIPLQESSILARAREAASRLKGGFPQGAKAGGNIETIDRDRGNSTPLPASLKKEGPFGSSLRHAQTVADELRAMRKIGEALHSPEPSTHSSSTTPLRMTYNPLSVYTSKSKLAPGTFSELLTPNSDPMLDDFSDTEDTDSGKGTNSINYIEFNPVT